MTLARRIDAEPRAWRRMLSGRRHDLLDLLDPSLLDLLDPSPLDIEIEIEDIAHGLARVPRWKGETCGRCPKTLTTP